VNVQQLIDILNDYPPHTEIEMAIVAPLEDEEQIAVDRYEVEGVLPWDEDDDSGAERVVLWLVGGEDDDVDAFMDAIEPEDDDGGHLGHDHDHEGHDHTDDGHGDAPGIGKRAGA
jgi:hypothetical protein